MVSSCEKEPTFEKPDFKLEEPDEIAAEDYSIYSLIIERYSSEKIVIAQRSGPGAHLNEDFPFYDNLKNNHTDIDDGLAQTYAEINASPVHFANEFSSDSKDVILLSTEELNYFFGRESHPDAGWEEFYDLYGSSGGYLGFSRIAYSVDNTQAILEMSSYAGSLGGEGSIVYLKKVDGEWAIAEIVTTWIS